MRIVIDARMYAESGVGRYIRNLIEQLQVIDQKNEYIILLTKENIDKVSFKESFKKILADFKWYGVLEQIKLPILLNKLKADLVHFPHFNVPIFYRKKFIVTIHDLIHQQFQMRRSTTHDPLTYRVKQLGYGKVFKNALNKSSNIIVPSNYVKDLLVKKWDVLEKKIEVTYEAVDENIISINKKITLDKTNKILSKFNINKPFIFYVGNAHPHKNIEGLVKAYLQLKKEYQDLSLVLSGNDHYFWDRVKKEFSDKGIIYTGFVSDEELVALYKNAQYFVMPSFEEGFGIPILEAMASGCPVISSDLGSLKEVGDNAVTYFNPKNEGDMLTELSKNLYNIKLRQELINRGRIRSKEFSWERLAQQTLDVYMKS